MSYVTVTTTTPPLTVVSTASTIPSKVTMASTSVGLAAALGQHDVLVSPL